MFYAFNSTLDIAVLIDGTFTSSEWTTIREFLVQFSEQFFVLSSLSRFAVVQFSQSAQTTFDFTRYSTNAELRTALSSLQQQSTGSVRNLHTALIYVNDNVFSQARSEAAWVYIVLLIPRLHDEAGSTSWLFERSSSQLVERSTSARRALDEQLRECLQYYTIQMTR